MCNIRGWQYTVVKKLISSSFRMTVILLWEVMADMVDIVDKVDRLHRIDRFYKIDKIDRVCS